MCGCECSVKALSGQKTRKALYKCSPFTQKSTLWVSEVKGERRHNISDVIVILLAHHEASPTLCLQSVTITQAAVAPDANSHARPPTSVRFGPLSNCYCAVLSQFYISFHLLRPKIALSQNKPNTCQSAETISSIFDANQLFLKQVHLLYIITAIITGISLKQKKCTVNKLIFSSHWLHFLVL